MGLICSGLPENVVRFLTDDLFNPMFSVIIGMMAGFVGPVIFLSLLVSISSLGSIRKLTDLGGNIFKRFVFSILFGITVSIFVSLLRGWEFLTAIYLSLGLCCALKLVKVSMKTNIGIPVLWKKVFPLVRKAFSTGSETSAMMMEYDLSQNSMGIFSVYMILASNYCTGANMLYTSLEQIEAAYVLNEIDMSYYESQFDGTNP